ncbi:hypothetical protein EMIHUDRAFT_470197 [Emiliania huxleyi CCMP1516]|uniref:Uncharacterized protein n=2 Tax=Emiliania huxleyi TaxID=2903 RepID=A0A0D3J5E8_EMIH1|nr:hypothetical protein EMIHUDRAFT_470197 [Emiliania huxleyi CCMP1516]EOD18733.1 hypothetical protein EMIHUDRAFT_470197 [Emiliania huxleyi CCMP1516]|eukprot:XP_005771162.1 hypothetical protein EMIHUDRAFT_470197 [Emiliania huxleyi CCMP1516]
MSSFTFVVEPIEASKTYQGDKRRHREPSRSPSLDGAWRTMIPTDKGMIESMSPAPNGTVEVFTRQNLFAKAGVANHVDQNAEGLRDRFVSHEGKEEIVIERPSFVKGSPHNDWEGVFPEFAEKIAAKTKGGVAELAQCDFSTTTPVERVVSQITLMDTVQHYFQYTMCCGCGFPSITLTGTPADWERVRSKAAALRSYDLDWWLDALLPALDHFVQAAHGRPDLDFWRSLCHINTGTSFPVYEPVTGWLQVFFPYLLAPGFDDGFGRGGGFDEAKGGVAKKKLRRNGGLANYAESFASKVNAANFGAQRRSGSSSRDSWNPPEGTGDGVKLELFPPGLSSAPFTYKDAMTGLQHKMAFYGGSSCLVQHTDGDLEPKVGWAVLDSGVLVGGPQPKQPLAEAQPPNATNVAGGA